MTFEQLEAFIAAVEHDNFFEAAETLHTTQSTLSKQIIKLEKELDLQLFDRSKRRAAITPAGQHFYQDALMLTLQYRQVLANIRQYRDFCRKELHVGTLPILNHYQLSPLFHAFSQQHQDIHLILEEAEEPALLRGLESGLYDAVVGRESMFSPEEYSLHPLTADELTAVLPASHPLAKERSLTFAELARERFLLMNRYTAVCQLCLRLFADAGITPNIVRTARVESLLSAVTAGEGISLLPESNFQVFRSEGLAAIPLSPAVPLPVVIASRKGKDGGCAARVRELVRFLMEKGC